MSIDDKFFDTMETVESYLEYRELTPDLENILVRMQIYNAYQAQHDEAYAAAVQSLLTEPLTTEQLKAKFLTFFAKANAHAGPEPRWNGWKFENTWARERAETQASA